MIYDVLKEPRKLLYRRLLEFSLDWCTKFLLVVRGMEWFDESAARALEKLSPFLIEQRSAREWYGTVLLGKDSAAVYYYVMCPESLQIIEELADGLYEWAMPRLPEDLCVIRSNDTPFLVSISHEKDAYLEMTENEKDVLVTALPEIESYLAPGR